MLRTTILLFFASEFCVLYEYSFVGKTINTTTIAAGQSVYECRATITDPTLALWQPTVVSVSCGNVFQGQFRVNMLHRGREKSDAPLRFQSCFPGKQMSEVRKTLDLMKRVEGVGGDRGARRLALELGTLALDRGENAAQRAGTTTVAEHGEALVSRFWIPVPLAVP